MATYSLVRSQVSTRSRPAPSPISTFKLISGFPSSSDVFLAMERGEVDGICESLDSVVGKRADWISIGGFSINYHMGIDGISLFFVLLSTLLTVLRTVSR